jgi:hypothetical protein
MIILHQATQLFFVANALALTTFTPDCTVPLLEPAYYVSSPNVRGTLDILWSCLLTLLICTWTVQHPNVPRQKNALRTNLILEARRSVVGAVWLKFKWMILTLVLPEFLVGFAIQDWMMAWRSSKDKVMKELAASDGREWTIVHAFYANMGGFVLKFKSQEMVSSISRGFPQVLSPVTVADHQAISNSRCSCRPKFRKPQQYQPHGYGRAQKGCSASFNGNFPRYPYQLVGYRP